MRIIVFAAFYHPYKGGYVESVHELAKRLVNRGHYLAIMTCNTHGQPKREYMDGVEIFRIAGWNPRWLNSSFTIPSPRAFITAWRFFRSGRYNVVSTQTRFFPTTWLGLIFAKISGLPLVHTERGSRYTASDNALIKWTGWLIDHSLGRLVCRLADKVVGVCGASCRFVARLGAKRIVAIHNGVDCDFWQRPSAADSGECNRDQFVIVAVGRLIKAKGIQDLIRAVSCLNNRRLKIKIIGDGPYKSALMKLGEELGISGQIEYAGELDRTRVREELLKADLFVSPSYSEGLPRSVLEAAAVGLPILASDAGGTSEIIENQRSGVLVRVGSDLTGPLERLLNDGSLRRRLAAAAKQRAADRFTWESAVDKYEKVFTEVVGKHQSAS